MPAPAVPHVAPPSFSLLALLRRDNDAITRLEMQSRDLARAMAAAATVDAPDGTTSEFDDRFRTIVGQLTTKNPLEGYRLRSSLGAFALARLSFGWAPPSATELREDPLDRSELVAELMKQGATLETVRRIVGTFELDEEALLDAFPEGLEATDLAGLAELSLSRREHSAAMTQISVSPRCLVRLGTTARVLESVRTVLPVLPSERLKLGSAFTLALAGLALGRPDRTLALIGHRPTDPILVPLAELAEVQWLLGRGDPVDLVHDPALMAVDYEEALADPAAFADAPHRPSIIPARVDDAGAFDDGTPTELAETHEVPELARDEGDDILEVVEEPVEPTAPPESTGETIPPPSDEWRAPKPAAWKYPDDAPRGLRERDLSRYYVARLTRRGLLAQCGDILGLRASRPPTWISDLSIPPDPAFLAQLLEGGQGDNEALAGAKVVEAIVPSVRAVLRIVAAAGEGWTPTAEAVEKAGDLAWIVRRARCLALLARGDLEAALLVVGPIGGSSSPEGSLALGRQLRYRGRDAPALDAAERRRAAAGLVRDLSVAFGRTIAGLSV